MKNDLAHRLLAALEAWEAADVRLQAAAVAYVRAAIAGQNGAGTFEALNALKDHLGTERYRLPAAFLDAIGPPGGAR